MPPSLEPTADQDFGWSSSETSGSGAAADLGAPFADGFARAIAEDEPPPGAGLAELLTRALAEHRAGTASAAALVKRLGPKRDEPSGYRPANGHRPHQEETFDNGHPRTGE